MMGKLQHGLEWFVLVFCVVNVCLCGLHLLMEL